MVYLSHNLVRINILLTRYIVDLSHNVVRINIILTSSTINTNTGQPLLDKLCKVHNLLTVELWHIIRIVLPQRVF